MIGTAVPIPRDPTNSENFLSSLKFLLHLITTLSSPTTLLLLLLQKNLKSDGFFRVNLVGYTYVIYGEKGDKAVGMLPIIKYHFTPSNCLYQFITLCEQRTQNSFHIH